MIRNVNFKPQWIQLLQVKWNCWVESGMSIEQAAGIAGVLVALLRTS